MLYQLSYEATEIGSISIVNLVTNFLVSLEQSIELLYCRQSCNLLQSILCKTDAFGTGAICPSIESQLKGAKKDRPTGGVYLSKVSIL